jgi:iron complex outermembrane receptor protein
MSKRIPALRALAVAAAGVAAGLCGSAPALAQETAQAGQPPVERIEITGSAIRRIQGETALPVTVIKADDLKNMGVTNVQEATERIAANQSLQGVAQAVGATTGGAAFADLRQLGANKTLVLLNGRRVANQAYTGGPNGGTADLSTIPLAAIERIEVLRDGASSLYGTDAVGGVINFILKRDFQGADVSAYYDGPTESGGGWSHGVSASLGYGSMVDQGFNFMFVIEDRTQDRLKAADRPYAATGNRPDLNFQATSSTSFPANIVAPVPGNPSLPTCQPPASYPNGAKTKCFEDFPEFVDLIPDVHQQSKLVRGSWRPFAENTVTAEYYIAENTPVVHVAPTPVTGIHLPASSPFYPGNGITPAVAGETGPLTIRWRTLPAGLRTQESDAITDRLVLDLDGSWKGVDYRAGFFRSTESTKDSFLDGYVNQTKIQRDLNSGLLNPFGNQTPGGLAALLADKVLGPVISAKGVTKGLDLKASSDVVTLPAGPLTAAVGGEVRIESLEFNLVTDPATGQPVAFNAVSSGLEGTSTIPSHSRHVDAAFGEFNIPTIKNLDVNISGRYDRYSDFGSTFNPKVSFRFQPITDLLLRGSWTKGFRAPTLYDIYQPRSITNTAGSYNDPVLCPGGTPTAGGTAVHDCGQQFLLATGGPAGAGLSASTLSPEKSKSWTIGGVWQVTSKASFGLDYWNIRLRDSIGTIPENEFFTNYGTYIPNFIRCNNPQYASVISTNQAVINQCVGAAANALAWVNALTTNLGEVHTDGVDVQANWRSTLPYGSVSFNFEGTYTNKYEFQNVKNGPFMSAAGVLAAINPPALVLKWQHVGWMSWDYAGFTTTLTDRFKSGWRDEDASQNGFIIDPTRIHYVSSYNVWDLFLAYHGIKNLTLTVGAKNIFDTPPPASWQSDTFQVGYYPRVSDPFGRIISVSGEWKFL